MKPYLRFLIGKLEVSVEGVRLKILGRVVVVILLSVECLLMRNQDFPRPWLSLYTCFSLLESLGDCIEMFRINQMVAAVSIP